jgi:transcriptional regulator with XRE-family HTH domain
MDLPVVVGRNVKRLRVERQLAQDELAHRADVHVTYLSGVENGRRNATLHVIERLARALRVPETRLLERQPASSPKPERQHGS